MKDIELCFFFFLWGGNIVKSKYIEPVRSGSGKQYTCISKTKRCSARA